LPVAPVYSRDRELGATLTDCLLRSLVPDSLSQHKVIYLIGSNAKAASSLKRLDLWIPGIGVSAYDIIRRQLPCIEYLTFNSILPWNHSDGIWYRDRDRNCISYSHLQSLQFRWTAVAYALYIPLIVRHFPSLKHLLISVCEKPTDVQVSSPPKGWHQAVDALWKVHRPLRTFQIEYMMTWQISCMTEIPIEHLVIANLRGNFLMKTLEEDPNYFPGLQTIRIQPEELNYSDDARLFTPKVLETLIKYCEKRNIELRRDATATSPHPRHHY
jgi:hypothetical protein